MSAIELYSEQDVETKIVVPRLRELGYVEEDQNRKVVFRFQYPLQAQQGRQRRTIFADLVVFAHDTPVIVIDSKKPRHYLADNDREQVISYARLIGNIAPYAVLCNGRVWQYFDTVTKQQLPNIPSYNEIFSDQQKRRLTTRQRTTLVDQANRTLFAIDSARELSRLIRQCHDVIRNLRGFDPTKAFDELSKVLFCKMYEEREVADGRRKDSRFTLPIVKQMRNDGVEIIHTIWRDTVRSDRYQDVFSDEEIAGEIDLPPEAVDKIVSILEDRSLTLTDLDVKGVAFEEFLAATYRGGGLGQYFTPREVVSFMVDLVDPAIGEKIIDPSCGTGGFLIRSYDVIREKIQSSEFSDREKTKYLEQLANQSLAGIDWEVRAARTCKMNMIIHGDGHAGVYQANALDLEEIDRKVAVRKRTNPAAPGIDEGTFDIVLANPPFGASDSVKRILDHYEMGQGKSQKREVLLLERCARLLRPGGRLAVVIPEGILSNHNDRHIRDYIRRHFIIKAVIRLPQDAFKMSEGAACTSILYAVKRDPTNPKLNEQGAIFFARAEHIGISPSGKPIEQNDLLALREHYRLFEEGKWDGLEFEEIDGDRITVIRSVPSSEGLWLEPEVNRTSLLYDRLSYVLRNPKLNNRFSYTYHHPAFYRVMEAMDEIRNSFSAPTLEDLCVDDYPRRGKKPSEEGSDGIPILKVRNITGNGIDIDTEYAPDNADVLAECARAIITKNDILVTSTGEGTIGRVDIYPYDDPSIADGHIAICRLKPEISPQYVAEFLRSEYGQIQMLRHVSGSTGQTELLIQYVKGIQIPLPPENLQTEMVEIMREAREQADGLIEDANKTRQKSAEIIASARARMYGLLSRDYHT